MATGKKWSDMIDEEEAQQSPVKDNTPIMDKAPIMDKIPKDNSPVQSTSPKTSPTKPIAQVKKSEVSKSEVSKSEAPKPTVPKKLLTLDTQMALNGNDWEARKKCGQSIPAHEEVNADVNRVIYERGQLFTGNSAIVNESEKVKKQLAFQSNLVKMERKKYLLFTECHIKKMKEAL